MINGMKDFDMNTHSTTYEIHDISPMNNKSFLLVEDNKFNMMIMVKMLKKLYPFINCIQAEDGEECIRIYKQNKENIILILLDIHMPHKDGICCCSEIREKERENNAKQNKEQNAEQNGIPIIAYTADITEDTMIKCIQAGFSSYMIKPALISDMKSVIDSLLPLLRFQNKNMETQSEISSESFSR